MTHELFIYIFCLFAYNLKASHINSTLTIYFTPTHSVLHCGHFCSLFSWWHFLLLVVSLSISPPILLAHSAMWWEDESRRTVNSISVKPVTSGRGSRRNICRWERGHTLAKEELTAGDNGKRWISIRNENNISHAAPKQRLNEVLGSSCE